MKEFKLILVLKDNSGNSLEGLNNAVISQVINKFGGATVFPALGYYVSNEGKTIIDQVLNLIISAEDVPETYAYLKNISRVYKVGGKQECVYLSTPNGVEFIK